MKIGTSQDEVGKRKSDLSPRSAQKQFSAAKAGPAPYNHSSFIGPAGGLSKKSESTPNEPISNTQAKLVKAMPDMNKGRSEKAIYGRFIA